MPRYDVSQMTLSPDGKVALFASEGLVPAIYYDSVGEPTVFLGITKWAVGEQAFNQFSWDMPDDAHLDPVIDYAIDLFATVWPDYEAVIKQTVSVPLAQHEFDALCHFVWNVGGPNFRKSRLLRTLNEGRYQQAGKTGFHGWLKPPELKGRRDMESAMFLRGDYGPQRVGVYRTDGKGKLRGLIRTMSRLEVLAMIESPMLAAPGPVPPQTAPALGPAIMAPVPQPPEPKAPQAPEALPGEIMDLIEETERGGAESRTNLLSALLAMLGIGGGSLGVLEQVDPKVALAIIAGAVVLGSVYMMQSRARKTRKGTAARLALFMAQAATGKPQVSARRRAA